MKIQLELALAVLCTLPASAAAVENGEATVFFKLSKGSSIAEFAAALRRDFPGVKVEPLVGDVYLAKEKDSRRGAGDLAGRLRAFNNVLAAQPGELSYPPKDEERTGEPDKKWFLDKIQAPLFWQKSKGSRSVRVMVCDTGIESGHPDLRGNIGAGINLVDGSGNTEPSGNGHGTRIAGLIGAQGWHTGTGAAGVNWEVSIIPGKISNKADGATDHADSAKCIKWGADQGIKVVNLSISNAAGNLAVQEAAEYLYNKGGILVVSAGNKGENLNLPDDPHMVVVGATNDLDWHPPAYNTGAYVDLSAPSSSLYTTDKGGGYITSNGTSLSAAIVSGAAALILSVKPGLTSQQLIDLLLASTVDLGAPGRDDVFGTGRLDLKKALELLAR
ncbi:MAG: S8 family serine peptidase [Elusimicrobiales bacterium]|nr:S8 family serine peptidase [Elusimicrobiales bacterium]